jgi:hypothetical protein
VYVCPKTTTLLQFVVLHARVTGALYETYEIPDDPFAVNELIVQIVGDVPTYAVTERDATAVPDVVYACNVKIWFAVIAGVVIEFAFALAPVYVVPKTFTLPQFEVFHSRVALVPFAIVADVCEPLIVNQFTVQVADAPTVTLTADVCVPFAPVAFKTKLCEFVRFAVFIELEFACEPVYVVPFTETLVQFEVFQESVTGELYATLADDEPFAVNELIVQFETTGAVTVNATTTEPL